MKLSVVIPCYNANIYIKEMLNCCMRQTFRDWEVLVIDDGSTDKTLNIIEPLAVEDSRIKIISRDREPKGADTCRNIGMRMAVGEYLIILDADDLISDHCFENRVRYMEDHPNCDYASFPATKFLDGEGIGKCKGVVYGSPKGPKEPLYYLLNANYPFTVWSNIYRRSSLTGLEWDEKVMVYQDFDFMVSCAIAGLKHEYAEVVECDYYYRAFVGGNNISSSFTSKAKCASTLYLVEKVFKSLNVRDDYEICKTEFLGLLLKHFERLLKMNDQEEIESFISLLSDYYSGHIMNKFRVIAKKTSRVKKESYKEAVMYYYFLRAFPSKYYLGWLLHSIIKSIK